MNKRIVSLLLALVMALSLAACGKTQTETKTGDEQITLTLGVNGKANVTEWDNNKLVLWLEEQTGYNLEVQVFATATAERQTQVSTLVAGGEKLPDIMYYFALGDEMVNMYGQDGYLLDMKPYFSEEHIAKLEDKYGFNLLDCIEKNCDESLKHRIFTEGLSPNGAMYSYPASSIDIATEATNMLYINRNWLDKLGLQMPKTVDELEHVLTEFITKDPNGNGKADELGMVGSVLVGRSNIPLWLINTKIYCHDTYMFNCTDDGEIYLPYDQDAYRDGLRVANRFYEKGLLPELNWTIQGSSELPAIFTPVDEVAKCGVWAGFGSLHTSTDNPTLYEYEALLPLEGAQPAVNPPSVSFNTYISGETEYPEEAFEVLYLLSTPEGNRRLRYGEYGVDWVWEDCPAECAYCQGQGVHGDGKAVKILDDEAYSGQTDSTFSNVSCNIGWFYEPDNYPEHFGKLDVDFMHTVYEPDDGVEDWHEYLNKIHYAHGYGYKDVANANNPKNIVFKLTYSEEENELMGTAKTDILTYAKEMRAKFISGEIDVDNDAEWQKYVDNIHKLGWDNAIAAAQSAWDRVNK